MNTNPIESKRSLRAQIRTLVKNMSALDKADGSQRICAQLPTQSIWTDARTILIYAPRANEVDIRPLFGLALAAGKRLVFPRFVAATGQYGAAQIRMPGQDLMPGKFDILEPRASCPEVDLHQVDLSIVPGIAFSTSGYRLGHGRGFFDRLLSCASGIRCGIAFDCQVLLEVPRESHDIQLHYVVTPTRWLECHNPAP